jgi:hypothetical protein
MMTRLLTFATIACLIALPSNNLNAFAATDPGKPAVSAIAAELETKLDTKSAKAGDPVSAKLLEDGTVKGATVPKGSKLLGKVIEAKSGALELLFESVQPKKGTAEGTHVSIIAIAPPVEDPGYTNPGMQHGSVAENAQYTGTSADGAYAHPGAIPAPRPGSTVKGVELTTGLTAEKSGMLSSGKDFKLDKGTRLWVALW